MNEVMCPHCQSVQIVAGRVEGGNFTPALRRTEPTAFIPMRVNARASLCLDCGLLWLRADVDAALSLIKRVGSPELQQRVSEWKKQGSQTTLLRAATEPDAQAGETLLRPAASGSQTPEKELLRPHTPTEE